MAKRKDRIYLPNGEPIELISGESKDVSDGSHTFYDLYEHRTALFLLVIAYNRKNSWWSHKDNNCEYCSPFILCGLILPKNKLEISYHLDNSYIPLLESLGVKQLPIAPKYDGHSSQDTYDRLINEALKNA
jgi:hypothetical protein